MIGVARQVLFYVHTQIWFAHFCMLMRRMRGVKIVQYVSVFSENNTRFLSYFISS